MQRSGWRVYLAGGSARCVVLSMAIISATAAADSIPARTASDGSTSHVERDDEAERIIRALVEQMTAAYSRGDAAGVAAPFAATGIMIAGDGTRVRTPVAIEKYLGKLMTSLPKGTRFEATVTDVRSLGRDAALVLSEGGFVMPGETAVTPARDGINGIIAVREAGTWRIALFQRTRRVVPRAASTPAK